MTNISLDDTDTMIYATPKSTKLPVDLFIADQYSNVPVGIYFMNTYEPLTDTNTDQICKLNIDTNMQPDQSLSIQQKDFELIKSWVQLNLQGLKDLFSGTISQLDFCRKLRPVTEAQVLIDPEVLEIMNEESINEMTMLRPDETGVPAIIYVSGAKASHGARIKVLDSKSTAKQGGNKSDLIPIPFGKFTNPQIDPAKFKVLKAKHLNKIREWIILNKDTLLKLYNNDIDETQIGQYLKSL